MESQPEARSRAPMGWPTWLALLVCAAGVYCGWRELWHMADDAYITFRYASNAMLGRGLVWNPAPFAPVDGNTYFLWSLVLLAVWRLFGVLPPDAANTISLLFGFAILFVLARAMLRAVLPASLERARFLLLCLALAFVASNRAFLASLSSGLGIAMFDWCVLTWVLLVSSRQTAASPRRWLLAGVVAAVSGLSRPEGHLVVLATCALIVVWCRSARRLGAGVAAIAAAVLPIATHLVWRRLTFGDWMPCPYYAKTVEAWPESGARFFASFVVEFGVWVWLAVAALWLVRKLRTVGPLAMFSLQRLGLLTAVGVLLFHFAYFTFFMGGDLFEWRVYSHLIPFLPLTFVDMVADLRPSRSFVVGSLAAFLLASLPVAWIKYANDDGPVAPHLPALLRPLVQPYDEWQRWLNLRAVCMRNTHMKVNFEVFVHRAPSREEGERIPFDGFPVHATQTVGVVGWVLPNVAIIDLLGLNDPVVARTPVPTAEERLERRTRQMIGEFEAFDKNHDQRVTPEEFAPFLAALQPDAPPGPEQLQRGVADVLRRFDIDGDGSVTRDEYIERGHLHGDRLLAHDRVPPPGYVEGFRPNVDVWNGKATVKARKAPLAEQDIRQHEATFRARFGAGR